jgi:predicted metal-dependent HD superfamily phosphohydrolase
MDERLHEAWHRMVAAIGGAAFTGPPAPGDRCPGVDLLTRWAEPQRHYHTTDHLRFMLSVIDRAPQTAADREIVRLAAWFHDAVYDPRAADNEERSAALASATPGVPAEVARLVLLTATHVVTPGDANGELLADADLAVLGSPPDRYLDYAHAIRREYAHVPDDAFRAGRSAVLRKLLDLPSLYHLPEHRARWDAEARRNMTGELAALAG